MFFVSVYRSLPRLLSLRFVYRVIFGAGLVFGEIWLSGIVFDRFAPTTKEMRGGFFLIWLFFDVLGFVYVLYRRNKMPD